MKHGPITHTQKIGYSRGSAYEADRRIIEEASGKALGACLIGAAQAVEHYEIARYGTLRQWAKELKNDEAHGLLSQILDMETRVNRKHDAPDHLGAEH